MKYQNEIRVETTRLTNNEKGRRARLKARSDLTNETFRGKINTLENKKEKLICKVVIENYLIV